MRASSCLAPRPLPPCWTLTVWVMQRMPQLAAGQRPALLRRRLPPLPAPRTRWPSVQLCHLHTAQQPMHPAVLLATTLGPQLPAAPSTAPSAAAARCWSAWGCLAAAGRPHRACLPAAQVRPGNGCRMSAWDAHSWAALSSSLLCSLRVSCAWFTALSAPSSSPRLPRQPRHRRCAGRPDLPAWQPVCRPAGGGAGGGARGSSQRRRLTPRHGSLAPRHWGCLPRWLWPGGGGRRGGGGSGGACWPVGAQQHGPEQPGIEAFWSVRRAR